MFEASIFSSGGDGVIFLLVPTVVLLVTLISSIRPTHHAPGCYQTLRRRLSSGLYRPHLFPTLIVGLPLFTSPGRPLFGRRGLDVGLRLDDLDLALLGLEIRLFIRILLGRFTDAYRLISYRRWRTCACWCWSFGCCRPSFININTIVEQ